MNKSIVFDSNKKINNDDKLYIIKYVIDSIEDAIEDYKGLIYWNSPKTYISKFINDSYLDYSSIVEKEKIWADLTIEVTKFYLEKAYFDITSDQFAFEDNTKKAVFEVIKKIFKDTINIIVEKGSTLKYNDIDKNCSFIRMKINDSQNIEIIDNDELLNELTVYLDQIILIINNKVNSAIAEFKSLYKIAGQNEEKDHINKLIDDLCLYYFSNLRKSLEGTYRLPFDEIFYQSESL